MVSRHQALYHQREVVLIFSFKKSNLRRTIVASMPLSIQAFSGVFWIAGYATYYFQLAGFSTSMSFKLGIIQQCLSVTGNVMSVSPPSPLPLYHIMLTPLVVHGRAIRSTIPPALRADHPHRPSPDHRRSRHSRFTRRYQRHSRSHSRLLLVIQRHHRRYSLRRHV